MTAKRCPLCGGNVKDNYCDSCGYSLPDEEDISALYNYDPTDYPQEESAIREITPEHITEEIYPNRPEPFEFKVKENADEPKKDTPFANPYANQNNGASGTSWAGGANGTANQSGGQTRGQSPYAQPYINNVPPQNNQQQNQNPYANNGNFNPYTNPNTNATGGSFGEFWKKYWLFALLTLFIPPIWGIIWLLMDGKKLDKKYKGYIIALMIIGIIFRI